MRIALPGLAALALALMLGGAGDSRAADLDRGYKDHAAPAPAHCRYVTDAHFLLSAPDTRSLKAEVWRRHKHAAVVANDPATIYSGSPRFLWASEAKVACARAYGYLRGHWKREWNVEALQKCECFYDRMLQYAGRR